MFNTSKVAVFFVAVSMSLAPVAANASIGDNVFSWPSEISDRSVVKQDSVQFGTTETLKSVTPAKENTKEKKQ